MGRGVMRELDVSHDALRKVVDKETADVALIVINEVTDDQ